MKMTKREQQEMIRDKVKEWVDKGGKIKEHGMTAKVDTLPTKGTGIQEIRARE